MIKYSAVIPSKDYQNLRFCVQNLIEHSDFLEDLVIIWNGSDEEYQILCAWIQDNNYLKAQVVLLRDDVYRMYNHGVEIAKYDLCLLINDDMYVPPSWDTPLMDIIVEQIKFEESVVTVQLVESGYVDVNSKNIQCDFGKEWENFDIVDFNQYNLKFSDDHSAFVSEFGWYMPIFVHRKWFKEFGKYPTNEPFPYPNDIEFFSNILFSGQIQPLKINSLVYHFQRLSQRTNSDIISDLPTKLNLCCGNDLRDGYLNADSIQAHPSVFQIDLKNGSLHKFPDNHFEEILFFHALEHFRFETGELILKELYRILKKDGILHIAVPNLRMACEDFLNGINRLDCAPPIQRIYGQNTSEELVHKSGYDSTTLIFQLLGIGFSVKIKDPRYPDELYIEGEKS